MMCVAIELEPGDMYKASMGVLLGIPRTGKIDSVSSEENRPLLGRYSMTTAPVPINGTVDSPFAIN
jgi:hypothetical protein